MDGGVDGPPCPYCGQRFPSDEGAKHQRGCWKKSVGAITKCKYCRTPYPHEYLFTHEPRCLGRELITNPLNPNINVVVVGCPASGSSTIIHRLRNLNYKFTEPPHELQAVVDGMILADAAVLVIDSTKDFEANHSLDDYTGNAFLAFGFEIKHVVCCFNKMDLVEDPEKRYRQLHESALRYLEGVGFETSKIECVPTSATRGDNIITKSTEFFWYKGDTVLEALKYRHHDDMKTTNLRIAIHDVDYLDEDDESDDNMLLKGLVHSGMVNEGSHLRFPTSAYYPLSFTARVRGLRVGDMVVNKVGPFEPFEFQLEHHPLVANVKRGYVASNPNDDSIGYVGQLNARLHILENMVVLDNPTLEERLLDPWTRATHEKAPKYICEIHKERAIIKLLCGSTQIERRSYRVIDNVDRVGLAAGDFAKVEMRVFTDLSAEPRPPHPSLGRIVIYDYYSSDNIVAVGMVTALTPADRKFRQGELQKAKKEQKRKKKNKKQQNVIYLERGLIRL